jgi:hypothetical protein
MGQTVNSTALVLIATGEAYRQHAQKLIISAKTFFVPHDVVMFTDNPSEFDVAYLYRRGSLGYPRATLTRYHAICGARDVLSKYEYIFYSDADMMFVAPVGIEIFSNGITATEHPGYVGSIGTPETNPQSAAFCAKLKTYFCGGFNGGTSAAFLQMAETLSKAVDQDDAKGILAVWHDESHLNRFLYHHPPARVLSPSYCYPESEYKSGGTGFYNDIWKNAGRENITPKLVALDKAKE